MFIIINSTPLAIKVTACCGSSGTCMLRGIKSPLGLGFFSAFFTFQLHVSDSLYSQALSFLTGP